MTDLSEILKERIPELMGKKQYISIYISILTLELLDRFCKEYKISRSKLIEGLIVKFLKENGGWIK